MTIEEVKKLRKVMFGAGWCGPCRTVKSQLKSLGIEVNYVDCDEEQALAKELNIRGVPVVIVWDEAGEEVGRHIGGGEAFEILKKND